MTSIEAVRRIHAACGRGDCAPGRSRRSDDVGRELATLPGPLPWLQPLRRREQVLQRLLTLAGTVALHRFAPAAMFGDASSVVSPVDPELTAHGTGGCSAEVDEVHVGHFGDAGMAVRRGQRRLPRGEQRRRQRRQRTRGAHRSGGLSDGVRRAARRARRG